MQPLSDRILIQRVGDAERVNGIVIPETARQKSIKGVVVAVGQGKWHPSEWWKVREYDIASDSFVRRWKLLPGWWQDVDVKVGQTVYFSSHHNDFANADYEGQLPIGADETLHLVREADVLGIVPA